MIAAPFPKKLYKLCRREHSLARGCRTLRIGSFKYYWRIENQDIGDLKEGIVTLRNQIPQELAWQIEGRNAVVPEGAEVHLMRPNTLMLSLTSDIAASISDYDDCYSIDDPQAFGQTVAMDIFRQVRMSDFALPDFRVSELHGVDIKWYAHPVVYLSEDQYLLHGSIDALRTTVDEWQGHPIELVKRAKYAHQSEVRYLFPLVHPRFGVLSCERDFVDVQLTEEYGPLETTIVGKNGALRNEA